MNNDLYFDGKKYISSKRASQLTGYSRDYIGELCRAQELDARMVGRAWFLTLSSLRDYQARTSLKEEKRREEVRGAKKDTVSELPVFDLKEELAKRRKELAQLQSPLSKSHKASLIAYESDSTPLLPVSKKASHKELDKPVDEVFEQTLPALDKDLVISHHYSVPSFISVFSKVSIALVVCVVCVVVGLSVSRVAREYRYTSLPAAVAQNEITRSWFDGASLGWYRFVNATFGQMKGMTLALFDGGVRVAVRDGRSEIPSQNENGIVVLPGSAEGKMNLEKIQNSFSDEVEVRKSDDGTTGVITPVFRKVSQDDYLFVMVPVKEQ